MKEFGYTPGTLKDCISETEKQLRQIICDIFFEKYGTDWQSKASLGFDLEEVREIKSRMNTEKEVFLDYCNILQLKEIIDENWSEFAKVFSSKDTTMQYLTTFNLFRNPEMHSRNIAKHETYLCLGICGQLMEDIDWYEGYKHEVKEYLCELVFAAFPGATTENNMQMQANTLGERWLTRLKGISTGKDNNTSNFAVCREQLIRLRKGHAKVVFHESRQQFNGQIYYASTVHLRTANQRVLDDVFS